MATKLGDLLADQREKEWRRAGATDQDIGLSRLSGMDARDVAALPQSAEPRTSLDPALTSGFAAVEPANRGAL